MEESAVLGPTVVEQAGIAADEAEAEARPVTGTKDPRLRTLGPGQPLLLPGPRGVARMSNLEVAVDREDTGMQDVEVSVQQASEQRSGVKEPSAGNSQQTSLRMMT
ncbi:hypothetical protein JX265_008976 [Neoarthrinium moseri]|uniref:Uncharacterized protein n=1 Tax=Neoarthrinium moseri TaxID=1658444 RepID=A0A9P9WH20_9PEZI|nr:hypothetical protein JX266_007293 [Neoarthrinium moseri]KAI1862930.1 hypothetical protein JX265_008976 [Neoarthrinium moseri]